MNHGNSGGITRSLHQASLPPHVLALCNGLLDLGSDFFERQLQAALNEFEDLLFKNAEHGRGEQQTEQFGSLRNLKRTRHDFIPQFLASLEQQLAGAGWLLGTQAGLADMAIAPFVRQFAQTDTDWFAAQDWPGLRSWLNAIVSSALFDSVMHKYPPWQSGADIVVFNPTGPI